LEDDENEYEELEDDFLIIANEGQVALVPVVEEPEQTEEYANKGVVIVRDEEAE
jgi:hypothetical protein